jgi:hypothetical protein
LGFAAVPRGLLRDHAAVLISLTVALLKHRTLDADQIEAIITKAKLA